METGKNITTLFLDIGGVLLTNGWGHISIHQAAEKFNLNEAEITKRHRLTFDTYELGKITLDTYLDRIVFYEQRPFTKQEFQEFMFVQSQKLPEMISFINELKKQNGLKVAVVNNEGRELNDYRIHTYHLNEFVDFFISSCFVHFRKPDEDMFRLALDVAQVSSEEVFYIEDQPMFVKVAAGLGIKGIQHVSYQDTREKLAVLGLKCKI